MEYDAFDCKLVIVHEGDWSIYEVGNEVTKIGSEPDEQSAKRHVQSILRTVRALYED